MSTSSLRLGPGCRFAGSDETRRRSSGRCSGAASSCCWGGRYRGHTHAGFECFLSRQLNLLYVDAASNPFYNGLSKAAQFRSSWQVRVSRIRCPSAQAGGVAGPKVFAASQWSECLSTLPKLLEFRLVIGWPVEVQDHVLQGSDLPSTCSCFAFCVGPDRRCAH